MATLHSKNAARLTGLFYLALAVTGAAGFLTIRPMLFAAGDPAATLAHLDDHLALAKAGVVLELLVVLTQALAAAGFYRLFRGNDPVNAAGIAAFGLVNSVVILASAAMLGAAVEVAGRPFGDAASTVQLLHLVSGHLWTVGGLFFGLWLIPMGRCVLGSGPRVLGWLLVVGGVGYILNTFASYVTPAVADFLVVPATAGELWMIGWLLVRGFSGRELSGVREKTPAIAAG
ncbi:DUF4386 domain-containing protein [Actinoplanes sp. KI2]|uniref:DUF4386 domain-containing protein n=1 Tax=Actinoplanes sp. KI2 TaxID=2983315 RepID=UPI0021D57A65|nr:DUF4386 domain-containing protein [Actinoplanes sp. KI2]MCU7727075.1 DUF4386 domain-containing protein [Actinoplanes sp. KI2]